MTKATRGLFAPGLEFAGEDAAEEAFDDGSAEGPQVVAAGSGAVEAAEQVALRRHRVRLGEREEDLVGEAERQAGCGMEMLVGRRVEADRAACEHRGRDRDDRRPRLDRPAVGVQAERSAS